MSESISAKLGTLPREPGVYLFRDARGRVIYIGKARNLFERVRTYFRENTEAGALGGPLRQEIRDLETIVVGSEKEAFILENEMIQRHRPRFNIRLREGGNFVYLRLDINQDYPRLEVTRWVRDDGARYFGPYPAASALRKTLRVVNRYFQLRTCSDHDPSIHRRFCLLCQISRFPEPSVYDIPRKQYRRHVENAVRFLEGRTTGLIRDLRRRMDAASRDRNFEEAARLRDQIHAIERTMEPQKIISDDRLDRDAFGIYRQNGRTGIYILYVRQGRVIGGQGFEPETPAAPDREVLASAVNMYYSRGHLIPDEVLLPFHVEGRQELAGLLSEKSGRPVRLRVPRKNPGRALVERSQRNAGAVLADQRQGAGRPTRALELLRKRLDLDHIPRVIECFDVSHLQGGVIVAAKTAMTDARLDKSRYRRFRIRSVDKGDDFSAMYEAVSRQVQHGLRADALPDLIVVDGGRPQLSAAQAALQAEGVDLTAVALAKKQRRQGQEKTPERIFLPGQTRPLVPAPDAPELLLLARLRDEAHRFAITYQKKTRRRQGMRSSLDAIPGIGKTRKKALFRRFGSIRQIAAASVEDLAVTEGIGPKMARQIKASLNADPGAQHPA